MTVRWWTEASDDMLRFRLSWVERGGPVVKAPERKGFGTRLIHSALASEFEAKTELRFPEGGVRFTVDADARRVLAGEDQLGPAAVPAA